MSEYWVFTHFSFVCLFHLITKIVAAHFEWFGMFVCFTPIFLLPTITMIIARDYFFSDFVCLFFFHYNYYRTGLSGLLQHFLPHSALPELLVFKMVNKLTIWVGVD